MIYLVNYHANFILFVATIGSFPPSIHPLITLEYIHTTSHLIRISTPYIDCQILKMDCIHMNTITTPRIVTCKLANDKTLFY